MFKKKENVKLAGKLNIVKSVLYVMDDYLIALSPENHHLFDISDKTNPTFISTFALSKGKYDENSLLGFINKKAYFRIGYESIEVIDFQDESHPVTSGMLPFVTIGPRCEFYRSHYLITNGRMPALYDVSTPSNPKTIYDFEDQITDFVLIKNYLICAILNNGIKVYDITEPSKPHVVSSLNVNAVKLTVKNHEVFVAQGLDNILYIIDISNIRNIRMTSEIRISGPIAANCLVCEKDYLFVRYMRKSHADTTEAFNISSIMSPKKIFNLKSANLPLYVCNDKLIVFMGIKDWDGVSPISKYDKSVYQFFSVYQDKVISIGTIELDGIYFSSIVLSDNVVYISRPDEVHVYEVKSR